MRTIQAQYVDIFHHEIFPAEILIDGNVIKSIQRLSNDVKFDQYILPGFVDAHIHIESSLMTPQFFCHEAVKHGTISTVSDPHEIANVNGVEGVKYMIDDASKCPLKIAFGAPSCVPATDFETAGARLNTEDVRDLLHLDDIYYLAEVMNFPGVMNDDPALMAMIHHALKVNKPVDGHAPQLREPMIREYFTKGISTDHECVTIEEAIEKLNIGCKILIREGSAAKNYQALSPLIHDHFQQLMFCSDDKHPDELVLGHINTLVARAISDGYDLFKVLQMACVNPVKHYKLPVGLLRVDDPADFIIVDSLQDFKILETWIDGECVYDNGVVNFQPVFSENINHFNLDKIYYSDDFVFKTTNPNSSIDMPVIGAIDGQLITEKLVSKLKIVHNTVQSDICHDVLKCVVVNRYQESPVSISFIKNFGLKKGAIASSIAHDSHNIIAVGADDESLAVAVNTIIQHKGGMTYVDKETVKVMPLEIAGLMTQRHAEELAEEYKELNRLVRQSGCILKAPFMTLSFMALPVIPHLKITDLGLFDVDKFDFVS